LEYHFYKRVGRVLGGIKAQRDKVGGRILLSDNTGGGMVMLLDSLVYTYIADLWSLAFRREHNSSCAGPFGTCQGVSINSFFYESQLK